MTAVGCVGKEGAVDLPIARDTELAMMRGAGYFEIPYPERHYCNSQKHKKGTNERKPVCSGIAFFHEGVKNRSKN